LAFAGAGTLLASTRKFMQTQNLRTETVQALRATIDSMTRDLRLVGACLPTTGDFTPLNAGTTDTITMRTGLVQPNLTCISSSLMANASAGATSLTLQSSAGFAVGMDAYIYDNANGEAFTIGAISGNTISSTTGMSRAYSGTAGSNATVYATDQRKYAIDTTTNPSVPTLTITVNGGSPMPFASGIEVMNIQYRLSRNCPPCDTVDLPSSTADWQLVNEIIVNVTARSQTTDLTGNYYRRSAQFIAKPRNMIPGG